MKDPSELIKKLCKPLEPRPTGLSPKLPDGPAIEAVIFDIYGTLFISAAGDIGKDSAAHSAKAFRLALEDAGIDHDRSGSSPDMAPDIFRQEIASRHERLKKQGVDYPEVDICSIWKRVLEKLGISTDTSPVPDARIMLLAVSYECRTNPVWPMPSAASILTELHERGIRTGIISNAQFYTPLMFRALMGKGVEELGFDQDLCVYSWKLGVAKPSIKMFEPVHRILTERYGIKPQSILYVGNDMLKDIMPAHTMGWKTCLFAGDRRSLRLRDNDPAVKGIRPWCTVSELRQIAEFIH